MTKLLGGEQFWRDIEEAINDHAFRFLFISTLESNRKEGTLRELKIAKTAQTRHAIKDFIVPIKADALPFNAVHADISDLNFVRFDNGWDEGLRQLLDLLQRESAPKSDNADPACVSEWDKRRRDRTRKSFVRDDNCISNWFEISLPPTLFFHRFGGLSAASSAVASALPYPHRVHADGIITFAAADQVETALAGIARPSSTTALVSLAFTRAGDESLDVRQRMPPTLSRTLSSGRGMGRWRRRACSRRTVPVAVSISQFVTISLFIA